MAIRAFNSLNKRQQLAVLIGAPAAVALILIVLIYRALGVLGPDPTDRLPGFIHRTIPGNLWSDINETEAKIAVEQIEIDKRAAVQKEMDGLEADVKAALERLPRESEKIDMRQLIEKLARDIPSDIGSVQVLSVRIIEDAGATASRSGGGGDDTQKVTYLTDITGDLNGIIKYIDVIEKNPRFMTVNSISIRPGSVSQDAEKRVVFTPHSVKMSLSTFVYNPGKGR
jgi:hypothetical protein